jgi:hypothetical protein
MTAPLLHAAEALADILAAENAALATLDIRAAAPLLPAKRQAADAFAGAHARLAAAGPPDATTRTLLQATAQRLGTLAEENRRLLERALAVQTRVMDVIAQAVPRASTQAPRYGAQGALVGHHTALPVAIAASA